MYLQNLLTNANKNILEEIDADVQDVISTSFVYTSTKYVPNRDDSGLSYELWKDKRGDKYLVQGIVREGDSLGIANLKEKKIQDTLSLKLSKVSVFRKILGIKKGKNEIFGGSTEK